MRQLQEVESIEAKRFGLAGILIITARGAEPIKLECQVGRARQFAEAFALAVATSNTAAG
ncbi:MAG TPA: hypothetical protein VLC49_14195 [Solirubrobacteraceae bacterium]|nr:hypothetical protein [Solirubrobacteraceae bacterium]